MTRLSLLAVVLAALAVPANAHASLAFLFDQSTAAPNDRMTLRALGTPRNFDQRRRLKPFQRPVRVYLVRSELAKKVRTRFDPRLSYIGSEVLGKLGRGLVTFSVPPLDPGEYTIAYWCPGCAQYSRRRTFYVQDPTQFVEPYRSRSRLRIRASDGCPLTTPNRNQPKGQPRNVTWHGNGLLWAASLRPDGIYAVSPDRVGPDGSIGAKLFWVTSPPSLAPAISGRRLDAPASPLRMLGAGQGSFMGAEAGSWATQVVFPTAGCWRLTARVRDVSLTYAVDVVVR
jgi:hypothetical protein